MAADLASAREYVERRGDAVAVARVGALLDRTQPADGVIGELVREQRDDGGFAPYWAPETSGIDATCARLVQLADLDPGPSEARSRAAAFLEASQRADGGWQEPGPVRDGAPNWLREADSATSLYLAGHCGLRLLEAGREQPAERAAGLIAGAVNGSGDMDSYAPAYWLAAALLRRLGDTGRADLLEQRLEDALGDLGPAGLAWLAAELAGRPIAARAGELLAAGQREDGSWASEDGPAFDIQATVSAIRALR